MCPEHDEKLKLFCVTDQQLACIICRDGERHEGHNFKPIREAAASLRKEMEKGVEYLPADIHAIESHANSQREEITKTKEKSHQLMTQISREFEEMHQFLRKREDEIKKELKHKEDDAVKKMSKSLKAIETTLSESRELEGKVTSALTVTDPERFLKIWTEGNSMTPEDLFRPRADDLMVVNTSLCLGPYASHLQFFMWKEMLQLIKPREEQLTLQSDSANITVSDVGRSLFFTSQGSKRQSQYLHGHGQSRDVLDCYAQYYNQVNYKQNISASSVRQFSSGQHYWEVEVGQRNYWEVGGQNTFLKFDGKKYYDSRQSKVLAFAGRPRKIGIYLNCESKELSFYDADNMTHIHTMLPGFRPVSAYFNMAVDRNPLIVCWY